VEGKGGGEEWVWVTEAGGGGFTTGFKSRCCVDFAKSAAKFSCAVCANIEGQDEKRDLGGKRVPSYLEQRQLMQFIHIMWSRLHGPTVTAVALQLNPYIN